MKDDIYEMNKMTFLKKHWNDFFVAYEEFQVHDTVGFSIFKQTFV